MNEVSLPITMTSKGTFTLPAKLRKEFGLNQKGDKLMLSYRPGSQKAELHAPLNIRAMQTEIAQLVPADIPPLHDVREYLNRAKLGNISKDYQAK